MININKDFVEHFMKNNENNLKFINNFWGIKATEKDIKNICDFSRTIKLRASGLGTTEISKLLKKPKGTVSKWIYKINLPIIIRLLEHYTKLGKPKKGRWLSLNSTRGGLFVGPWIFVPEKINSYEDVYEVINQLNPLPETYKKAKKFNLNSNFIRKNKYLFFAYLLGIMIGDASKYGVQRKQRIMRRIQLKLTKKHKSNEYLGDFVNLCINSLGLRTSRCKDVPPSKKNVYYFYSWNSQSSLLVSWIFEVCLGLKDGERTTYNPIKSEWMLNSPDDFKIWFLQGIADSDGFIDINTFQAGIISKPNINFIQKIFDELNIKSQKEYLHGGTLGCLRVNLKDANKLPLFNEYVKLYRYSLMKKLIKAKRFSHHWPEWLGKEVNEYIEKDFSSTKIMKIILNKYNIVVRAGGVGKRIRKYKKWKEKS